MAEPNEVRVMFAVVATTLSAESIPLTPLEEWILRSWWELDRDWRPSSSRESDAEARLTLKLEWYLAGVLAGRFPNPLAARRVRDALRVAV